ncbi:MAG: (d)CMP kinase [candidate division Zixibacteria bacterium]|nr:(d)CMP kinase [candidate division Zixibacteria bacterium]
MNYKLSALAGKIIAIDGPAGSGKSTTARLLASKIGYRFLDTGAMYRVVAWVALKKGISVDDGNSLELISRQVEINFEMDGETNRVFLFGKEMTDEIRTMEVTKAVSPISVHAGVRTAMVKRQRVMAQNGSVVAEGRDTTSVVFPNADLKIYLDATIEERAQRRLLELARRGISTTFEELKREIYRRDKRDSKRENSPLTKTADSVVIDTTALTIEGQVDRIIKLIKARFLN